MKYLLVGEETARLRYRMLLTNDFDTWIELFKQKGVETFLEWQTFLLLKSSVKSGLK